MPGLWLSGPQGTVPSRYPSWVPQRWSCASQCLSCCSPGLAGGLPTPTAHSREGGLPTPHIMWQGGRAVHPHTMQQEKRAAYPNTT